VVECRIAEFTRELFASCAGAVVNGDALRALHLLPCGELKTGPKARPEQREFELSHRRNSALLVHCVSTVARELSHSRSGPSDIDIDSRRPRSGKKWASPCLYGECLAGRWRNIVSPDLGGPEQDDQRRDRGGLHHVYPQQISSSLRRSSGMRWDVVIRTPIPWPFEPFRAKLNSISSRSRTSSVRQRPPRSTRTSDDSEGGGLPHAYRGFPPNRGRGTS